MTTSSSYTKQDWIPLSKDSRRWEAGRSLLPTSPSLSGPGPLVSLSEQEDFATEAGYSRPQFLQRPVSDNERDPPMIKEHHVWGVQDDWGPKSGKWGQGAKAFRRNDPVTKKSQ